MNQIFNIRFKIVYICIFAVFAISAVAFPAIIYLDAQRVTTIVESNYNYIDEPLLVCKIENYIQTKGGITLQGWFAEAGKEIKSRKCYVVLKSLDDGTCLQLPTKVVSNSNAKAYFKDGFNYNDAGFSSTVQTNYLQTNNTYLVLILYENDGQMVLFKTDQTITAGQLTKQYGVIL